MAQNTRMRNNKYGKETQKTRQPTNSLITPLTVDRFENCNKLGKSKQKHNTNMEDMTNYSRTSIVYKLNLR